MVALCRSQMDEIDATGLPAKVSRCNGEARRITSFAGKRWDRLETGPDLAPPSVMTPIIASLPLNDIRRIG
jgi:hypothetical protein